MTLDGWRVEERDGLRLVRCRALESVPHLAHAFSTRYERPGYETREFDLGSHENDGAGLEARRRRFCDAAGLVGRRATILRQVHGNTVLCPTHPTAIVRGQAADGVVALRAVGVAGLAPAVRWADCVPILLADRRGRSAAAIHAGWRGTAAGIVGQALRALGAQGIAPDQLVAAVGPAIGGCCYEVGPEVLRAVARATGTGAEPPVARGSMLDLRLAVRMQLEREGLAPGSVHVAPWCTCCHDDLFFSFRRDAARSGRQMACIGWPQA